MKDKPWWEKAIEETDRIHAAHEGMTYEDLIKTVKFDREAKYCHPTTSNIFSEFGLNETYGTDYEVKFLAQRDTSYVWICTDTLVGVSIVYFIDEFGGETSIGVAEQSARKSGVSYFFFTQEWADKVKKKLIEMIEHGDNGPVIKSCKDKPTLRRY